MQSVDLSHGIQKLILPTHIGRSIVFENTPSRGSFSDIDITYYLQEAIVMKPWPSLKSAFLSGTRVSQIRRRFKFHF